MSISTTNDGKANGKPKRPRTTSLHCDPLASVSRHDGTPPNRLGNDPVGAYPEVSRTKLAERVGKHKSTISNILRGRTKPTLEIALVMAETMRVPVGVLDKALAAQRERYKKDSVTK